MLLPTINWLIAKLMSQCGMSTVHGSHTSTGTLSMVLICIRDQHKRKTKIYVVTDDKLVAKVMSQYGTSTMVHLNRHFKRCSHLC